MSETAIIYVRVSTSEQAQRGYSQRSQEEKLNKYCRNNHIEVLRTIFEDHSAKNFDRPEWKAMMKSLSSNKSLRPRLILFTRWDRFSRNTANAYYVINQLNKIGIEPQAIDQPLDMSVPENKVLLAMYIVTAEVENARRSLNIKQGMRRAKQEGRYMGHAPIGYINISLPDGRKTIVPHEPEATLIKQAYELTTQGNTTRGIYRLLIQLGLKCSISAFFNLLHNPIYYGKIISRTNEESKQTLINGIHTPIISEELFKLAQIKLTHRVEKYKTHHLNSHLLFRGILQCPNCSRKLSGSGSKGRNQRYFYYHCYYPCKFRIRADDLNDLMINKIRELKPDPKYLRLFKQIITKELNLTHGEKEIGKTRINQCLHQLMDHASKTSELFYSGIINEDDYQLIRLDCEKRIDQFGDKLNALYKIDLLNRKKLSKISTYFNQPSILFSEGDSILKLKFVKLFFKDAFCCDMNNLGVLKDEFKIVCSGIPENKDSINESKLDDSPDDIEEIYKQIIKIEAANGQKISTFYAKKTRDFLTSWANIIIDHLIKR